MKKKKVILFCSWIKSRGGVEKEILELLSKSKHEIEVYTWAYDSRNTFEELKKYKINVVGPKSGLRLSRGFLSRGLFLFVSLFTKIPIDKYDKLLVVTSGVSEFILFRNYKPKNTIVLVNTPLREASKKIFDWNLKNRKWGFFKKLSYINSVKFYRIFEKLAWKKFDVAIYNSKFVHERSKENCLREAPKEYIVYPQFNEKINYKAYSNKSLKEKKYFLYVSRLNPPKRQDILIKAWKKFSVKNPGYNLYIVGNTETKSYLAKLKKLSRKNKNISIMQNVTNEELNKYYANCIAGIYIPFQEDFGIVPFEIIAAKKPLICIDEGGFNELITGGDSIYKIKEVESSDTLIERIVESLGKFIKNSNYNNIFSGTLQKYDFVEEMDKIIQKE